MNLQSMTGFANISTEHLDKRIDLEIRSVNSRFLDFHFKIPETLRHLEPILREIMKQQIVRGKIEFRIQINHIQNQSSHLSINQNLVDELAQLNHQLRQHHPDLLPLSVADVLKFPNVMITPEEDSEALDQAIVQMLERALPEFTASRKREGNKLQTHIVERLDLMEQLIHTLKQLFPELLQQHMDKARTRLATAIHNIDEDRLKQEFALFMQKADVDEEFSRLHTHINEVRRIVTEHQGAMGKRLDFLMQELNREANTLGSKTIATECTQVSVELKVLIEQMREQIQNIE